MAMTTPRVCAHPLDEIALDKGNDIAICGRCGACFQPLMLIERWRDAGVELVAPSNQTRTPVPWP
jgi:hypothetical protein